MGQPRPDSDRRLDGNAAGGLLGEIFRVEVTTVVCTCAGCGAIGPLAELMDYGAPMGAILRCPDCDGVVLRAARAGGHLWLDLRGTVVLRTESDAEKLTVITEGGSDDRRPR